MRIEHGTYTVADQITSGVEYPLSSKIYTNDVDNTSVTFLLEDDTTVTMTVYKGTILPLVTKQANYAGGTLIALR
tara:strand:- start:1334 stop:1558 length:225 start_codon:yes stop_codon:yes gene_type:complete